MINLFPLSSKQNDHKEHLFLACFSPGILLQKYLDIHRKENLIISQFYPLSKAGSTFNFMAKEALNQVGSRNHLEQQQQKVLIENLLLYTLYTHTHTHACMHAHTCEVLPGSRVPARLWSLLPL